MEVTVRSDKGTRIALGCAGAVLGLFFLAGVFVMALVAAGDSRDKVPGLLIGLVFALIPGLGLLLVGWLWKQSAAREARKMRAPDQPWTWDQEIQGGEVAGASPTTGIVVMSIFAGIWLSITALYTVLAWDQMRAQTVLMAVLGLFWLAGVFLASLAVRAVLHARRFGRSTLVLDAVPSRLGGWLSGVVRGPQEAQDAELQVTVECVQTTHQRSGSGSSRSTWTIWRTTKVIDGTRCPRDAAGVEIPFAVRLPTNQEVSRERNDNVLSSILGSSQVDLVGEDMDWYVGVQGRLPGVDYSDRFKVPVAAAETGAAPAPPPREMPELGGDRLAQRLPGRLEHGTDADVFVFPVKPSWVVWTLIFLIAGGLCAAQYFLGVPLAQKIEDTPLIWGGLITGGIGVLCLVGLMLDTRRIEVAPQAVRVRRGVLGIGFHRTIPRAEIAAVEEEASRSDPPTYTVNIKTREGKSYWAAMSLTEADQAAALAMRLRDVLQLGARR